MAPEYNILNLSMHFETCHSSEKQCGNPNGFMACVPINVSCPINDISIVPKDKQDEKWTYVEFSETHNIGYTREAIFDPVLSIIALEKKPCLNYKYNQI